MSKKDKAFNDLLDSALGKDNSFASLVSGATQESSVLPSKKAEVSNQVTPAQRRAVAQAQNSQRGRGKTKGARTMIAFKVPDSTIEALDNLHYSTGITKNDLYNEALELLLEKYKNI